MSTLVKPYTFTAGTYAIAQQVNANFDAVLGWINGGKAMWSDGTTAFTSIPTLPAADPTTANQAARKSYVDTQITANNLAQIQRGTTKQALKLAANSTVVNLDAGGHASVAMGYTFTTIVGVVVSNGDYTAQPNVYVTSTPTSNSAFEIAALHTVPGGSPGAGIPVPATGAFRCNWIAFGI